MIGIGFSTTTEFAPVYKGLDFHVYNRSEFGDVIANRTWIHSNRSLTEFDFDVVNEGEISDEVWNATHRNLTYYEPTDLTSLANLTAAEVWSASTRELTSFGTLVTEIWEFVSRYTHGILLS